MRTDTPTLVKLSHLSLIKYSNSTTYVGTVIEKNSKLRTGIGYMEHGVDHFYVGEWLNNTYDGVGILQITPKMSYWGEFEAGNRHGIGLQLLETHEEYLGEFLNNERNGIGILLQKCSTEDAAKDRTSRQDY